MFRKVQQTIQRPNNTTQYAAGDVIGTASSHVMAFSSSANPPAWGKSAVLGATVISNEAPTTLPSLELWLLSAAPADQADNAALAITDAELANLIGIYPLSSSYVGYASNNHVQLSAVRAFGFEAIETIYGILVVRNAYTPVASEIYRVVLSLSD